MSLVCCCQLAVAQADSANSKQIESILSKLSIEEKAGQLNLISITGEPTEKHLQMIREGKVGSIIK